MILFIQENWSLKYIENITESGASLSRPETEYYAKNSQSELKGHFKFQNWLIYDFASTLNTN